MRIVHYDPFIWYSEYHGLMLLLAAVVCIYKQSCWCNAQCVCM